MWTGHVELSVEFGEAESWAEDMESGIPAPEVTGGTIKLPLGGTRQSQAAATGGIYKAGSEAGTGVISEFMSMAESLLPSEVSAEMQDLDGAPERIAELSVFFTNLLKNRISVYASEYSDNADEAAATATLINSATVVIKVEGLPTTKELEKYIIQQLGFEGG